MKEVIDIIAARLAVDASGTIYRALSGRIWRNEAPEDSAKPVGVWDLPNGLDTERGFGGTLHRGALEVQFWSGRTSGDECYTLAAALQTTIDGWDGGSGSTIRVHLKRQQAGVPSLEDDVWTMTERYSVTAYITE